MKIIILSMVILSNILIAGMNGTQLDYQKYDKLSVNSILEELATETSKNLPIVLDPITKIIQMFAAGNKMIVNKEINIFYPEFKGLWSKPGVKQKVMNKSFNQDLHNICNGRLFGYLINKRNSLVAFYYKDPNKKLLFSYTIEKIDCNKIK